MYGTLIKSKNNVSAKPQLQGSHQIGNRSISGTPIHVRSSTSAGANYVDPRKTSIKSKYPEKIPTRGQRAVPTKVIPSEKNVHSTVNSRGSIRLKLEENDKKTSSVHSTSARRGSFATRGNTNKDVKIPLVSDTIEEATEPPHSVDVSIQTDETDITDTSGDVKTMIPSHEIINEIENHRLEEKKRNLLNTKRKFEPHAQRQEQHLTDLKEFLERSAITKRIRQPPETLERDRRVISSMDDIMSRPLPKCESFTNIKSRIKKKERELLSLFDSVENVKLQISSVKDKSL